AVSEATVLAMVEGALAHSRAQWVVAESGIAGPSGGSPAKPVGTVCFAWGGPDGLRQVTTCHFSGDREAVRAATVAQALNTLLHVLETPLAA
ncbi:MAG TPA: CinA family protein, partial [Azospira sp.]|nr:CinA family protein [Azospira sp.]